MSPSVAQLDPFIKLAFDRRADRLELGAGAPVTITVGDVNEEPVFTSADSFTIAENAAATVKLLPFSYS